MSRLRRSTSRAAPPRSASSSPSCGPSTTRRSARLRGRLRADLDLLQGVRLHRAVLRRHRPGGEEGRVCWPRSSFPNWTKSTSGRWRRSSWTRGWSSRPGSWWRWPRATSRWPTAQLAEAKANVGKYQAEVVRWDSEVKRLTQMVQEKVVDKQVLAETQTATRFEQGGARRRPGRRGRAGSRSGDQPGQSGKGQDRRGDRQGQGQGVRGRRAQGGRPAGLHQGDRPLRRRGDGPQRQHRRLRAGGHRRQVDAQSVGDFRRGADRHRADLRGRARAIMPATCRKGPRPWSGPRPSAACRSPPP